MRMGTGLSPVPLQELHRALWSIYLRVGSDAADGPQSVESALEALYSLWWPAVPRALPVVGTALWDLLGCYTKKRPPARFTALLEEVLDLKLPRARELRREPQHGALPPFAEPLICESSFHVSANGAKVQMSVCLEANFDELSALLQPEEWPKLCPLFWASVKRNGDGWDAQWHPPLTEGGKPLNVRLEEKIAVANKTETMADIRVMPEGQFGQARLVFILRPEEQKPGWARVTHAREVRFGPEVPHAYRKGTVAYWTKSEIACLVLQ